MPPGEGTSAKTVVAPALDVDAKGRLFGMMLMIISSVGISFGGLVSRLIEGADAWQINIYRSLSTVMVVAIVLLFRYRGRVVGELTKIGRPGFLGASLLAIAGVAFMQAITTTTVANTLFTLSAIPFITAGLAWMFLRERLSRITLATMVAAAGGVGIMLAEGLGGGSFYGNVMALVTALGFSGYAVVLRRHRMIDMLPALLLSAVMILALSLLIRIGDWSVTWWDLFMCFIWGGLLSGIGNVLFIAATRYLLAAEVTLFMLLEFSLGPLWVWLFVNEVPSSWTLLGGALIMTAVLARTLYQVRESRRVLARTSLSGPL
jgi:drug/metabolite transporter (DMT)-like permease